MPNYTQEQQKNRKQGGQKTQGQQPAKYKRQAELNNLKKQFNSNF